jgi:hypothetical protein
MRARPRANEAVVMTPMAASEPMARRRVTAVTPSAEARPQRPAPMKKLMPTRSLAAKPPKMAWDRPWPM